MFRLSEDVRLEVIEPPIADDHTSLKMNISLQKQLIDCLSEAGTKGMTLNDISAALGDFDKRTIDLLLNRLAKDPPPPHLADLGVVQVGESHGRERRYKYYTVAHYRDLVDKEQLDDERFRDTDQSAVGGFLLVEADAFYEDTAALERHLDGVATGKGRAAGKKKRVNPILPDGTVKKGRPRKSALPAGGDGAPALAPSKRGRKRKRDVEEEAEGEGARAETEAADDAVEPPPKKRRGRPPKNPPADSASQAGPSTSTASAPRKRGRPPKQTPADTSQDNTKAGPSTITLESVSQGPTPKRRGRPPKKARIAEEGDVPQSNAQEDGDKNAPLLSTLSSPVPSGAGANSIGETAPPTTPAADTSIRRSTRMPKARKRGDSLSPTRTSARRARRTTLARAAKDAAEDSTDRMQVDGELIDSASATDGRPEAAESYPDSLQTQLPPVAAAGEPAARFLAEEPLAELPTQIHAEAAPNVPIDPALLGTGALSPTLQEPSLITTVVRFLLDE